MPYKKEKRDCVQSDGDKGKYVLSYTTKKGEKRENCHTSEKNMQGQIAAIEGGPVDEKEKKHPKQYSAPQGSKRAKQLSATQADLKSGDPERIARAYRRRERMEKQERNRPDFKNKPRKDTKKESVRMTETELRTAIREMLDEELSKKTKETLRKKAKKRGLTPGSVYAEYKKGLAAWASSGSRKGMTQHQWAMARVNAATPSKSWAVVKKSKAKKSKNESVMSEALAYHHAHGKGVDENIFRPGSDAFFELFVEARRLFREGNYDLSEKEAELLLGTDIGEWADYNGNPVPLHWPMENEDIDEAVYNGDKVKLRDPKRGGPKKYYVYVNSGKKTEDGQIKAKKVPFGDPNMKVRISDPERRANFAARHRCAEKDDETKPGYWSCRLGRYPHLTGSKKKYTWW